MVPVIVGRTPSEQAAGLERVRAVFPRVPEDAAGWRGAGLLFGTPEEVGADLRRWQGLGIGRVMLQMLDQDDLEAIAVIAREVIPAFA